MEYTVILLPKSEAEIQVALPSSEFEPHVKRAAILISEARDFEGFRRGKAPYEVVKARLGEHAIYEEAAELAIRRTYPEILQEIIAEKQKSEGEFTPIGRPEVTITKIAPGNDFEYKVKLALIPKATLPDYSEIAGRIAKEKKESVIEDEEVTKTLEWVRESRAHVITVDRPAASEDLVEIDLGIRHNGVKIENGESKNHPVVIGKGKFIPGLEDNLVGMSAGEEKTFTLAVPETWHEKNYAGKALDIFAKMNMVQERKVPELTDEFAKGIGNFDSADALRASVRDGMLQEKREKEKQRVRMLIIEKIASEAQMEIPDVLVERELDKMMEELKLGIENMGMKWEEYLLHIKKTPDELRGEWRQEAQKRVRIALCLREIGNKEKIEPAEEEVIQQADKYLAQYKIAQQAGKTIDPDALREYIRGTLRNEKVFEFLERAEAK
ncbi:MAG: Trigger factor [Parcubacteria group bacterium Gr01-1014_33]|nr:MAG: Trigger factor [Parcubacteria group bacterium Gr01-1014_33]